MKILNHKNLQKIKKNKKKKIYIIYNKNDLSEKESHEIKEEKKDNIVTNINTFEIINSKNDLINPYTLNKIELDKLKENLEINDQNEAILQIKENIKNNFDISKKEEQQTNQEN